MSPAFGRPDNSRAAAGAPRWRHLVSGLALGTLCLMAACGPLPQPYAGRPGGQAPILSVPMLMRLAVPTPHQALLADASATQLAQDLARALNAADIPTAVVEQPLPLDWRLAIHAENQGEQIISHFQVSDADGAQLGTVDGPPVPAQAWANGDPAALQRVSATVAPKLATLMAKAEAARASTTVKALQAKGPPKLRLASVSGAPGDGDQAIARLATRFLHEQGIAVEDSAEKASFGLRVTIAVGAPETDTDAGPDGRHALVQVVEIHWHVSRRDGQDLGDVAQLNSVPAGSLDQHWGDVAFAVAQQGAAGVKQVLDNAAAPATAKSRGGLATPEGSDTAPLPAPKAAAPVSTSRGGTSR